MENKELEEKSSPTEQVTTTEKKTKPKDPGRIAAGKKLAEYNKKAREAKKAGRKNKEIPKENKDEIPKENNQEGSFSLTQILSVVSIVVSLAGLYYKRKELMSFVRPPRERRVGRRSRAFARISSRSRIESQRFKIETNGLKLIL